MRVESGRRVRTRYICHGRVQGVGFRYTARDVALRLGLVGWVRNLPDGTVEAVAEGNEAAVAAFTRWCREGPPMARVTRVDVTYPPVMEDLTGFEVRF